jgi:hypothetical protein
MINFAIPFKLFLSILWIVMRNTHFELPLDLIWSSGGRRFVI